MDRLVRLARSGKEWFGMAGMKIRASYSLLHAWEQGRIDQSLLWYFHVPHKTPREYVEGTKWDKFAQEYITENGKLPLEWGGDQLEDYRIQYKITIPYNRICTLSGVFDVYEPRVITELKSGKSSASDYARTQQVPIYLLLAREKGLPVTFGRIIRYDPHLRFSDRAIIYSSDEIIDRARNYIDSIVPEIYEYFKEHDLFRPEEEIRNELDKKYNKDL